MLVTFEVVEVGVVELIGIAAETEVVGAGAITGAAASWLSTFSVVNVGVSLMTEEMLETLTSKKLIKRLLQ